MAVARADLVGSPSTFTLCIQLQQILETQEMICYVLAMGKQRLRPHVVVGYGIKIFWPFITSPDHLVVIYFLASNKELTIHQKTRLSRKREVRSAECGV